MLPQQNSNFNKVPWTTWQSNFGAGASLLVTNGSTTIDRFGPDLPSPISLDPSQDEATNIFQQENFRVGFLWASTSYRSDTFRSALAIYPGVYALNGWTYGYVQDNVANLGDLGNVLVSVSWLGSEANIPIQLIIGVNLTLTMLFKQEHIITGIPYNASVRIRVFDQGDTLVAAANMFSDGGTLVSNSNAGFFADGTRILQRPIPAGTKTLQYLNLAGQLGYVDPTTGPTSMGTSAGVRAATLFSPDHGIWGSSDHAGAYGGGWTVMVDVVNWSTLTSNYPPVQGLLQGESPYFFPYNHLGPYAQSGYAQVSNAPQGGEASAEFELDLRGYVSGLVLAMNWKQDIRTTSWVTVRFDSNGNSIYWYDWEGFFDGYLDPGLYHTTFTEWETNEGHVSQSLDITVNTGQSSHATNVILEESNIPIPETSTYVAILMITLTISLLALRLSRGRKRRQ